ncbi:MAG: VWA domain-containing protein [Candidatus Bipolaricaulota bacterium]|nr:VWA domain-containing protein [Candidatus Bipolaricaulota bacterium]MDW8127110.1 VWA domain-containing protein [Candidatus Bipolaricaulota bacterium]
MRAMCLAVLLLAVGLGTLAGPTGYMFILDASNSMNDPWTAGRTKIAWAKEALIQTIQTIPESTSFGLVAFGHRLPGEPKAQSCADIELVLAYGVHSATERSAVVQKIQGLGAKGWTPLAEALKFGAASAPTGTRLILLTDGEETCGGDPLAVVTSLCPKGYVVDVVGIALEAQAQASLRALAEKCGGKFILAEDPTKLPGLLIELAAPTPAVTVPSCFAKYKVDANIIALLLQHLPYAPCTDPMWDVILCFLQTNPPEKVIVGSDGDDSLFGTPGNDLILGLGGNDRIFGFEGNDLLIGGPGDDMIQGGGGCDLILGGSGKDLLFGGDGDDTIYGEDGDDRIEGEAGNDKLFGGPCSDVILGGPGCNFIDGGPGLNFIYDDGSCAPCPQATACPPTAPKTPQVCAPSQPVAPVGLITPAKTVDEGKSIVLRAQVYDPDKDLIKVTWSAPKGHFSDPNGIETIYYAPMVSDCGGEFVSITVVAEDCCGGRAQDTIIVHVLNVNNPPMVEAGPDLVVDEGQKVQIQATAVDPDGDPITVLWSIPCNRGTLDNPRSLTPVYTAPLTSKCEGEVVELVVAVRDACGAEAKDTVRIFVRNVNQAPWADAGPDLTVPECGQVTILGRAGDPDRDPIQIFWTVTAGKLIGADTLCPVFVAPEVEGCEPLKVIATLRVVDACGGMAEDQVVITVTNVNRPPTVKADP